MKILCTMNTCFDFLLMQFIFLQNLGLESPTTGPPWKTSDYSSITSSTSFLEKRLPTSQSSPVSGFGNLSTSPRLPKAQNPTITLLQKARGKTF